MKKYRTQHLTPVVEGFTPPVTDTIVYLAADIDSLLDKIKQCRREGIYEDDPAWNEIDQALGLMSYG